MRTRRIIFINIIALVLNLRFVYLILFAVAVFIMQVIFDAVFAISSLTCFSVACAFSGFRFFSSCFLYHALRLLLLILIIIGFGACMLCAFSLFLCPACSVCAFWILGLACYVIFLPLLISRFILLYNFNKEMYEINMSK